MSVDAHTLRVALDDALELAATGIELRKRVHRLITQDITEICALVREQDSLSRSLGGVLDELTRTAQHAEHNPQQPDPLAIKAVARALRPVLRVLRDQQAHSTEQYVRAVTDLRAIVAKVPEHKLRSSSMSKQLGPGPHGYLLAYLDGDIVEHEATVAA